MRSANGSVDRAAARRRFRGEPFGLFDAFTVACSGGEGIGSRAQGRDSIEEALT
jgi:hypothetical protein